MRFRFYPTVQQKAQLEKDFGCARYAYNWTLRLRSDAYKDGETIGYAESSREWTKHRRDPAFSFLRESSSVSQQQAVRQLQRAYINFFAKRAGYPRFHSKKGKQSALYTLSAFAWDERNKGITISRIGRLRVKWSRVFTGSPTNITIIKDGCGRYFVTLCVDEPAPELLPKTGEKVGVDLGVSRLATLSNGERISNPRHTAKHAVKLAKLQRAVDRKTIGSNRWARQKNKVAKYYSHISACRVDFLNKLTTDIVKRFDVIAIEDLDAAAMRKNKSLAKHVSCASFGIFREMITYKCVWYGKELRVADRFFPSSKRCNNCGHIHSKMPLDMRILSCEKCGVSTDRDENAARNILKFAEEIPTTTAGQAECNGRGERVSLVRASARISSALRNVNRAALGDARHLPPAIPKSNLNGGCQIPSQ